MSDDQMQDHLNNAMYGPKQTNPDERRHYLGSLRERVLLRVDNQTLTQAATLPALKAHVPTLVGGDHHALINGKLDASITGPIMKLLGECNMPLTMVNDDTAETTADTTGLLIISNQAVNVDDITLSIPVAAADNTPKAKKRFRLFH